MHILSYYTGVVLTLAIVTLVGLHAVRKIKTSNDYIVGGRNLYSAAIAGAIVGSFVGGTVTIGTAQMAYKYGLGAIWFTIGAGLSCLLLALFRHDSASNQVARAFSITAFPYRNNHKFHTKKLFA